MSMTSGHDHQEVAEVAAAGSLVACAPRLARLQRSQYWGPERLAAHQQRRLGSVLAAAAHIPFYADHFGSGDINRKLSELPILRRSRVPELTRSVQSLFPPGTKFLSDRSSGSTGMPVDFLFDASHQRARFAARARYLLSNGWTPLHRSAWIIYLPGQTPDGRLVRNRLFVNAHFLSVFTDFDEQLKWLDRLQPTFLYTLPSNLGSLLDRIDGTRRALPSLRRVFCGGEVVDEALRERVRSALGVEISDNYGSTEAFLAWQCRHGGYHLNAEHVVVELVGDNDEEVNAGSLGRVVVTTLDNRLCPLIRYEIGDYAEIAQRSCPCGRTLPLLERVAGRSINMFRLKDRRLVSPWKLVVRLKFDDALTQFQIVQQEVDRFVLRYVAEAALEEQVEDRIRTTFQEILGVDSTVSYQHVDGIPRSSTGKFMTAVSELDDSPHGEDA
jgi:phenylacetate-CoA ligase